MQPLPQQDHSYKFRVPEYMCQELQYPLQSTGPHHQTNLLHRPEQ